jgi:hypothetical protein
VVAGTVTVHTEGAEGLSPDAGDPQVFALDLDWDGGVRRAAFGRWPLGWRLHSPSLSVARGSRGEVLVGGTIFEDIDGPRPGGRDWALMRWAADGRWEWAQAYGGLLDEDLRRVAATPDGGAILVGMSRSVEVRGDAWVLRVGPDGHIGDGGGCQAERERASEGERLDAVVTVSELAVSDEGVEAVPSGDLEPVVTAPAFNAEQTTVARQCSGLSTPLPPPPRPDPRPPPPPPPPPHPTPDPTRNLQISYYYPLTPPLTVTFAAYFLPEAQDPPGLVFSWWFRDQGGTPDVTGPAPGSSYPSYTYAQPGTYTIRVRAEYDPGVVKEQTVTINVGL